MTNSKLLMGALAFCSFLTAAPAYAYLDPGTGSLLIQGIIGAIAAVGVAGKIYWHKLRMLFGGKSAEKSDSDNNDSDNNASGT